MSASKVIVLILLTLSLRSIASAAASAEQSGLQAAMTLEEIAAQRRALREQTMLPSLHGIRSISYRVVGLKNFETLEKIMASKLEQLNIKTTPLLKSKNDKKPLDAMVQISFTKVDQHMIAELKVTQWTTLIRDPKLSVKAVTYSDKLYLEREKPEEAVEKLSNQLVIDFLKANQRDFDLKPNSDSPAPSTRIKSGKRR